MSVQIRLEEGTKTSSGEVSDTEKLDWDLTLEYFLGASNSRKVERPQDVYDMLNSKVPKARSKKKTTIREIRTKKHIRETTSRQGNGPVSYKKVAEDIEVELFLIDLFQISPDLSKFHGLSSLIKVLIIIV